MNLISENEIQKIGRKYLNHNYVTDVITFDYLNHLTNNSKGELLKRDIEGELFICLKKVKENSKLYSTRFSDEFKRVIIHGCLHLLGYNDKNVFQVKKMRIKEDFYLKNDF